MRRIKYRLNRAIHGRNEALRIQGITIGRHCRVLSDLDTSEPWLISIGDRVTISTNVTILTHDGVGWLFNDANGRRYRYARVEIGSNVFIGSGAIIMPGVKIEDHCVVGAGAVVTKSVPQGTIVAGSPARIVGNWQELEDRIAAWPSDADRVGTEYREKVNSVVDPSYAAFINGRY